LNEALDTAREEEVAEFLIQIEVAKKEYDNLSA